jgi:hypothetical protein
MKKLAVLFLSVISLLFAVPTLEFMPNQVLNTTSAVSFGSLTTGAIIGTTGTFTTLNIPAITVVITSAATLTTGNTNIAVRDSTGTVYYIKANTVI